MKSVSSNDEYQHCFQVRELPRQRPPNGEALHKLTDKRGKGWRSQRTGVCEPEIADWQFNVQFFVELCFSVPGRFTVSSQSFG